MLINLLNLQFVKVHLNYDLVLVFNSFVLGMMGVRVLVSLLDFRFRLVSRLKLMLMLMLVLGLMLS